MNKQSGFTLIEIVMVLVLLGILSAVAVPKYFDLQKQAEEKAAQAVGAEYQAHLNGEFAKQILTGTTTCTTALSTAITNTNTNFKVNGETFTLDTSAIVDAAAGKLVELKIKGKATTDEHKFKIAVPACDNTAKQTTTPPATNP